MNTKSSPWQARFDLKTCAADEIDPAIPTTAPGVAVVYAESADGETIFLVLESRARGLRDLCIRRLQTAKIPADTQLKVSFKSIPLANTSPESVHAACREQVILAGELRRELRPSMR